MKTDNITINPAVGASRTEIILREGLAPKMLEPQPPVKMNITGTIGSVVEFLTKRLDTGQFHQGDCHILVDREKVTITLVINESSAYDRGMIVGQLSHNPKFVDFGINQDKAWTPTELGLFIKMNRAFFADRKTNMELVSTLMNFTATINNKIERSMQENGNRIDNFAQVVNSNLPESFTIQMPIFKGMPAETIEVETFAHVNGREVAFMLLSPGAQATLEDLRDKVIDDEITKIRELAPGIAIIEV